MSEIPNIDERWDNGIPHRARSLLLFRSIMNIDDLNHDYFDWRLGGDGDNGEELLYILDILYDLGWKFVPPEDERL